MSENNMTLEIGRALAQLCGNLLKASTEEQREVWIQDLAVNAFKGTSIDAEQFIKDVQGEAQVVPLDLAKQSADGFNKAAELILSASNDIQAAKEATAKLDRYTLS